MFFVASVGLCATASPAHATTLTDGFKAATLNPQWAVVSSGTIQTGVGTPQSLLISNARINTSSVNLGGGSFAVARMMLTGDYQKFGYDVNAEGFSHVGVYFDTVEAAFGGGTNTVNATVRNCTVSPCAVQQKQIGVSWGAWHVFRIDFNNGTANFFVDGTQVASMTVPTTTARPVGVWNDRSIPLVVDWVFATTTAVNLSYAQVDAIATDLDDKDFCGAACNAKATIKGFAAQHGVIFTSNIVSTSAAKQSFGIFVLDESQDDIIFPPSPFDFRVTTVDDSATFSDLGWGGIFGPNSPPLGFIGAVQLSNIVRTGSPPLNSQLTLWFYRDGDIELTPLPIRLTIK